MRLASRRRTAVLGLWAVLPLLTALLVLRPAPAQGQDPAVGFFALTVTAATTNTSGDIGAGGGLVPVDSGAPVVKGRLDSSPTASMVAAAVEPGTLYRTVAALGNNEIGDEVVPVEFAEAAFPGGPDEDVSDPTATGVQGPFASGTVQARARADRRAISGAARVSEQAIGAGDVPITSPPGTVLGPLLDRLGQLALRFPTAVSVPAADEPPLLRQQGGQAEATATGDPDAGTLVASAASTAETITVAGVITLTDLTGHAVTRLEDGELTSTAATTYSGITVAGVPVALTTRGLVVAEDVPLLPGQDVATLEDQLNAVLEAAGVQIAPISAVEKAGGGTALADSGGVRISITTPSSAAVPANVVDLVIGQAVATLAAEAPMAASPVPTSGGLAPSDTTAVPPSTGGTAGVPPSGTPVQLTPPSTPGPGGPPAPTVAGPVADTAATEPTMVLAGRELPRRTALALFGGWQLLSLSTCTLAAFALRPGGRPA